jgi:hypothetical protein
MLRPFQVGKARTSHDRPWSWIRESRVASAQESSSGAEICSCGLLSVILVDQATKAVAAALLHCGKSVHSEAATRL